MHRQQPTLATRALHRADDFLERPQTLFHSRSRFLRSCPLSPHLPLARPSIYHSLTRVPHPRIRLYSYMHLLNKRHHHHEPSPPRTHTQALSPSKLSAQTRRPSHQPKKKTALIC
ncbi:hypothetical protein EJ04DRAFT_301099 [Polyplosphaeria fusca]|uniref:Uncharacterized protein n=1 Tax=Polyplosphaeria fusca TaxID=682080 RepID=A0A9P4UY85_9PLEO|nr:hypothetical protein EJ04DRAFT_301099 [Polyplosphaeria fusca]